MSTNDGAVWRDLLQGPSNPLVGADDIWNAAEAANVASSLRASAVGRLLDVIKVSSTESEVAAAVCQRLVQYVSYQVAAAELPGVVEELEMWQACVWRSAGRSASQQPQQQQQQQQQQLQQVSGYQTGLGSPHRIVSAPLLKHSPSLGSATSRPPSAQSALRLPPLAGQSPPRAWTPDSNEEGMPERATSTDDGSKGILDTLDVGPEDPGRSSAPPITGPRRRSILAPHPQQGGGVTGGGSGSSGSSSRLSAGLQAGPRRNTVSGRSTPPSSPTTSQQLPLVYTQPLPSHLLLPNAQQPTQPQLQHSASAGSRSSNSRTPSRMPAATAAAAGTTASRQPALPVPLPGSLHQYQQQLGRRWRQTPQLSLQLEWGRPKGSSGTQGQRSSPSPYQQSNGGAIGGSTQTNFSAVITRRVRELMKDQMDTVQQESRPRDVRMTSKTVMAAILAAGQAGQPVNAEELESD